MRLLIYPFFFVTSGHALLSIFENSLFRTYLIDSTRFHQNIIKHCRIEFCYFAKEKYHCDMMDKPNQSTCANLTHLA